MNKFFANVFMISVSVLCGIGVMIYGWGLTPRSWWWIIGVGLFLNIFVHVMWDMLKKEGEK